MNISETIIDLVTERGAAKTICPSEVARKLWPHNWRYHMEEVRNVALQLRKEGKVFIKQKGKTVEDSELKGPIRIAITS